MFSGVKNLNELRAKDLASEAGDETDVEAELDLTPEQEIEAVLEDAKALDAMLQDLDSYYGTTLYTRLGCLCHKVGDS